MRRAKLDAQQQKQLRAMLDAGPELEEWLATHDRTILHQRIRERFDTLWREA